MDKIKFYFMLSMLSLALFSCSKSDDTAPAAPPRAYAEQYATDIKAIEEYLKTYYIEEVTADFDIKLTKIPEGGTQTAIFDQNVYPLKFREVKLHDVLYKIYYLELRKGTGKSPTNVDAVFTGYKGTLLDGTVFDSSNTGQRQFNLDGSSIDGGFGVFVKGWSEIFPQFKTGTYTDNLDGTITYKDFGAGVMFLPSGLAYYNSSTEYIKAYSPLIFSIKLYEIRRLDQDGDGIPSYLEDVDGDGYMYDFRSNKLYPTKPVTNTDDTDGDGIPDCFDVDDDGDSYTTLLERSYKDANGVTKYYDFDAIPTCTGGNGKKRHLDPKCHN